MKKSHIPRKFPRPFVSARYRQADDTKDGVFRVVLITSGSVASIKVPDIVGALVKTPNIDVQVVATKASSHFYTQADVDKSVRNAYSISENLGGDEIGVRVWTDHDEWSDWHKVGEPILHIELRRWADLVVIAPCSADLLAKIAGGICDSLATSLLRALSPSTPVILCPAMNTHMYQHKLTAKHLAFVQDELEYLISGPQGSGQLACGDNGPGKMTDWRDIVAFVQKFALMHQNSASAVTDPQLSSKEPGVSQPGPSTLSAPNLSSPASDHPNNFHKWAASLLLDNSGHSQSSTGVVDQRTSTDGHGDDGRT
ncbi:hypothetical protein L204_103868 [Cryptococcus depauperatus]|nr:phosphopantothenoylcysteine decarboxylase [Cryptococcus depauperatus CBS 7855]